MRGRAGSGAARLVWVALALGCGFGGGSDGGPDGSPPVDGGLDGTIGADGRAGGDGGPDGAAARDAEATGDGGAPPCGVMRADVRSPPDSASWRYGGGAGYPDMVLPGPCLTVVHTADELASALADAAPGEVVYVDDDARIDLTGESLCIPEGVTLASGRGRNGSPGGLLYVTVTESKAMLRACGDDVRLTGLRLQGWEPTQCPPEWPDRCTGEDRTGGRNCRDCRPRSRGIQAAGRDRLEVDNCEMTGWSYGAVEFRDSRDNHVHHNHIHHNQRQGLGYGVVLSNVEDPADVLIEHNRFDYNRHSVAASGAEGHSYEARQNLVLSHANGHVFDMHGIDEATGDGTPWAGTEILVHDNTVLPPDHYAVVVRGRPTEGSWTWSNCLARAGPGEAARQTRFTGNFSVDEAPDGTRAPNAYGQSAADCEPLRFCDSPGGSGPWRYRSRSSYGLEALGFGDFDGDGMTDVLRPDGERWWWLSAGRGGWEPRNTSSARLGQLAFGDFDGDGSTDVFRADGAAWWVSYGARSGWERLNTSSARLESLGFGDFDGDGRTDVFRANGSEWFMSPGGSGGWERLNASSYGVESLGFGDFDGDGKTDVLRPDGARWNVVWGGKGGWQTLAVSSVRLGAMAFGDFDGDGRTDVFRTGCL